MFNAAPAWVRKGAVIDLDFVNQRYFGGYVSRGNGNSAGDRMKSLLTSGSNSTAGVCYAPDATGVLVPEKTQAALRIVPGVGLYTESDTSNTCLWCRDLTNAVWAATSMTVAKNQTGADNVANAASSLTATGSAATVLQSITSTSGTRTFSAYVKRLTGTGTVGLTMDGSTYTDITASINSAGYTRVFVPLAATTNPVVGFRLSTAGDAIAVDFCQQEKLNGTGAPAVPTTPQLTTSAATTRLAGGSTEEAFFYTPAAQYNDGIRWINDYTCKRPVAFVVVASGNAPAATACLVTGVDVGGYLVANGVNGAAFAGATGGVAGIANFNKMAYSLGGSTRRACVNGNAIASAAQSFDGTTQATHGGLGNNGGGGVSINGIVQRATYWVRELTDSEMLEYTR